MEELVVNKKKKACRTCGGKFDARYIETPCPSCGNTYGAPKPETLIENKEFVQKAKDLTIPEQYIGRIWDKQVLLKDKEDDATNRHFNRFVTQLERIHSIFENGLLPAKSAIIVAPPKCSKAVWAYSCMQLAVGKGFSVAPILDTIELKRLLVLAGEKPTTKLYGGINYDEYMTSDVVFVTVTKTEYAYDAWKVILEILDRRSRRGLPTFILSRYDVKTMSRYDYNKQFDHVVDFNGNENPLKYPVIIQYTGSFN
ncbi:hypothetical protein UT300012_24160 [Paraclostridium bifermentans]